MNELIFLLRLFRNGLISFCIEDEKKVTIEGVWGKLAPQKGRRDPEVFLGVAAPPHPRVCTIWNFCTYVSPINFQDITSKKKVKEYA